MTGHHISSLKMLLGVAGALFLLTLLTVGVGYLSLPHPWAIIVAMAIATFKAALVALFFMNLYWDKRFNTILFLLSLLFLGLLIGLTLMDTLYRNPVIPNF